MPSPELSIILIGYNNKRFLKPCLEALERQTLGAKRQGEHPFSIYFIDNASSDDSVEWVLRHHPEVRVLQNRDNVGYAAAANQGIRMTKSKYVMILNPDLILTPDYLKIVLAKLRKNPRIAAITGKILRYDFERDQPTTVFDTTGLLAYRSRRVVDRGQGEKDRGQYDRGEEVFGVSGAGPIYRREALEDVKLPDLARGNAPAPTHQEYLDEDFFMYKEDVDLAWRLRLRGWQCYYEPRAVGYHGRGTGAIPRSTLGEIFRGRRTLNRFQKYYSYKNQYLMQVKNDVWPNVVRHLPSILWHELLKAVHVLLREPYLIKAWVHFWIQLPRALKKRRIIMRRRTATAEEMAQWFRP